jgi:hypothetical protein
MKKTAILVLFACVVGQAQKKGEEGNTLLEASLAVAKRVCAAHPDASVWVYHEKSWDAYPCGRLQPIFDLDTDNSFDALIPLIEDIHSPSSSKSKETK